MRIQHNISALTAYRNYTANNSAVTSNLEKLSSGYKINRAGDDAAGLAISEKMRAQITGLETAQKNANDGISLVQTAEGALTEVHSMLNRMVELATQSANGTYSDDVDRQNLQKEIESLQDEIDRISESTNYNGINLLDGTLGLNTNTFTDIKTTAAVEGGTKSGDELGVTAKHYNDESSTPAAAQFTISMGDMNVKTSSASATATVAIKVGGKSVSFYSDINSAADTGNAIAIDNLSVSSATSAGASSIATGITGGTAMKGSTAATHARIGNEVYSVAVNAAGDGLTFTYAGKVEGTAVTTETNGGMVPVGDVEVTVTGTNIETENRDDCHVTNITDGVSGGDVVRAGATLKLDQSLIASGNTLTIGDTTFKFDDSVAPGAGGTGVIGIKDVDDDDLLQSVTQQLSSQTATITKDVNGTSTQFTFNIGRSTDVGTIEIEERGANGGDMATFGSFEEDELTDAFSMTVGDSPAKCSVTLASNPQENDSIVVNGTTYTFTKDGSGTNEVQIGASAKDSAANLAAAVGGTVNEKTVTVTAASIKDPAPTITSKGLTLQIGDTADDFNQLSVAVQSMSTVSLGIDGIDISSQVGAQDAISKIKNAINTVSSVRGDLGAIQNRLDHTINNLSVTTENMTAAESRIRDVDMAEELMDYTKNNILVQASQAMLAQANQLPQGVLQLLQ